MNMLGPKAAEKGKRAEILTAAQIVHSWNGKTLADLDIVTSNIKTIAIPKWMTEVVINIKNFGTAQQLGFPDDLEVIKAIKSGSLKEHVLLFPANLMGPDMLLLIYKDGVWFGCALGEKIYSTNITNEVFRQNNWVTDLSYVYMTNAVKACIEAKKEQKPESQAQDENKEKQSMKEQNRMTKEQDQFHQITDEAFRNNPNNIGGILRLHVLLPSVVGTATNYLPPVNANSKEVNLYITKENVSSLFPESNVLKVLSEATNTKLH